MYIYHALINALSAHMIHINLNMIFYTHVVHSPTKTIYIKKQKEDENEKKKNEDEDENNNNNVHLSCAHQRPERSHDT